MTKKRFSFTGGKLRELAPPHEGRACFHDATVQGLIFEITEKGAKSFRVYRKFKGRPLKITLGHFDPDTPETRDLPAGAEPLDLLGNHPALNVRMARKLAIAVIAELDTGVNPTQANARKGMTLGDLFARYCSYLTTEGKKSVSGVTWMWERYLGQLPEAGRKLHGAERTKAAGAVNWERRPISEIGHEQVSRLRLDLGEKVGRTTANRVIELLRAMYNFAKRERLYTGENPAEDIGKFDLVSRERSLHSDEIQKFFNALDAFEDQDFADYVRMSLFTGARRGNVIRMRWDELSLAGARWTVGGELMKNGEPLTIPLVQEAVDVLGRRTEGANGSPWVFPGGAAAGHMGAQRKRWAALLKAAGLTDFRVHDLRRSLGSWMADTGASTVLTMRALGHKTINAALIYQRLSAEPVRGAMQSAVTKMLRTASGKAQVIPIRKARKARAGK
jgi:integrase